MNKSGPEIRLFGHRGARGEAPENTLGGFEYAFNSGVKAFELDIHLSKDNQLVVIHDATLDRTTDGTGRVSDYTAEELSSLNAARHFSNWPKREGIPSLHDVLERYQSDIQRWQLEIKTDTPQRLRIICKLLAHLIDRYELRNRVTVTSFDPVALQVQREIAPHLRLGFITESLERGDIIRQAQNLGCSELCISVKISSKSLITSAHEAGLEVTGWVGNTPAELETLLAWGVNNITTDVPSFARQYLADLQWPVL